MIVLFLSTFSKHLNLHNIDKRKLLQPIRSELCMSLELTSVVAAAAAEAAVLAHVDTHSHLYRALCVCV